MPDLVVFAHAGEVDIAKLGLFIDFWLRQDFFLAVGDKGPTNGCDVFETGRSGAIFKDFPDTLFLGAEFPECPVTGNV
jgi:hypothetical protein